MPSEGFKKGLFDNNVIVEVWEENLIEKFHSSKKRLRIITENQGAKKNYMVRTSKNKANFKRKSQ